MLEITMIQSTARPKEAESQAAKAVQKNTQEDPEAQEFQSEYDATDDKNDSVGKEGVEVEKVQKTSEDPKVLSEENTKDVLTVDNDRDVEELGGDIPIAARPPSESASPELPVTARAPSFSENVTASNASIGQKKNSTSNNMKVEMSLDALPTAIVEEAGVEAKAETAVLKKIDLSKNSTVETAIMSRAAENAPKTEAITSLNSKFPTEHKSKSPAETIIQTTPTAIENRGKPTEHLSAFNEVRSKRTDEKSYRSMELRHETAPQAPLQSNATIVPKQATTSVLSTFKPISVNEKLDTALPVITELDSMSSLNPRAIEQTTTAALNQVINRPETPSMIARQMAEALQRMPDRPVEISLNPKELGRVRMHISAVEAGITVNVVAERPETLDLMRRNIEQLTREFQALGYENINFAFSEGEAKQSFGEENSDNSESTITEIDLTPEEDLHPLHQTTVATNGVDIRL